ncbi:MAG: hypothetical protein ACR2PR_03430 [Pseudohongiellaceae bacterium]
MAVHLIVLTCSIDSIDNGPGAEIIKNIKKRYPTHYPVGNNNYLVRSKEVAAQVANNVGLKGDDKVDDATGVVFKLNTTYSGYESSSLWDWMELEE